MSGETMDVAAAAAVLEVPESRVHAMVDEGLLTPLPGDRTRFSAVEVNALRQQGG